MDQSLPTPAPGGAVPSLHRGLLAAFLTVLLSSDLSLDTFIILFLPFFPKMCLIMAPLPL